ncbi:TetR/AcrR family transcriptional regulator [Paenibacillus macerans]|uniref:TetR/AcrR family transcriptional regulator n=1 Tax=Paenibacillus macerans TaxID=44252 RepID=UPI003D31DA78
MNGYQRRTELKKEKIKRAAVELFTAYGSDKVSLAEIAKQAGVSPVTIYNYYGTKDELFVKVVTEMLEEAWQERLQLIRSDLPFLEKIEKMIFETADFAQKVDPEFLKTIMSGNPEIKALTEDIVKRYLPPMMGFFEEGKKAGYINADVSAETFWLYMNLLAEVSGKIELFKDKDKNRRLFKELTSLLFYGLVGPKGRENPASLRDG